MFVRDRVTVKTRARGTSGYIGGQRGNDVRRESAIERDPHGQHHGFLAVARNGGRTGPPDVHAPAQPAQRPSVAASALFWLPRVADSCLRRIFGPLQTAMNTFMTHTAHDRARRRGW